MCVCPRTLACSLYVIMCARTVGASMGAKAVCTHCSGTSFSLDAPLWLHFLFMNIHISTSEHKIAVFPFLFPFLSISSLSMKSLSSSFNMPASPFFIPLSVSWVLISVVHVFLLYQSSQGICIPNEQSTSLTCKLMDVNYAFIAGC